MLSQDDRRQLDVIEYHLTATDPVFVRALGEGKPRRPCGDRRWPLWLAMAVAGAVFLVGLVAAIVWVIVVAAVACTAAGVAYRLQVRRSHGHPVRRRERDSL
jgi:hypothetical protein